MGGDNDIRHGYQKRQCTVLPGHLGAVFVKPLAFLLVDIQSSRADLTISERGKQSFAVHQGSAGGIDENDARFDLGECLRVEQMFGFRHERAVQRYDIRFREQSINRNELNAVLRLRESVVCEDTHPETEADTRENAADLAHPDHADGFPVKVEACKPHKREVEFSGPGGGLVNVPVQRQKQGREYARKEFQTPEQGRPRGESRSSRASACSRMTCLQSSPSTSPKALSASILPSMA